MSTRTSPINQTCALKDLLGIINPDTGDFRCVGWAPSKGRRCRNFIAQHNCSAAYIILRNLPQHYNNEQMLRSELRRLAGLSLCVRFHQCQATAVADRWYRRILRQRREETIVDFVGADVADEIQSLEQRLEELIRRHEEDRRMLAEERRRRDERRQEAERRRDQEVRRRDEERQREEARQEEQRQEEERRREEEQRQREEQARREQEEARQRQDEARRQRGARQRADAEAREERERSQRERIAQEWADSWARYERDWGNMRRVDTSDLDEDVRESVPWPVKSGRWQDVNEANVRSFLRRAPDDAAENSRRFRLLLRRQLMRWHEDRLRHFFPRVAEDEECLRLGVLVCQVVNGLMGVSSSL